MRAAFGTELVYSSTRLQQALWVPTIECLRTSSAQGPTSEGRSSQVQGSGNSRCPHLPNPGSAFSLSLPGVLCALLLQHLEEKGSIVTTGDVCPSSHCGDGCAEPHPSSVRVVLQSSVSLMKQESCRLTCGLGGQPVVAGESMECMKK